MHCYLYHLLLQDKRLQREYSTRDGMPIILLHREYPTVGKYVKEEGFLKPSQRGRRGHFDLAILNPDLVGKAAIVDSCILLEAVE